MDNLHLFFEKIKNKRKIDSGTFLCDLKPVIRVATIKVAFEVYPTLFSNAASPFSRYLYYEFFVGKCRLQQEKKDLVATLTLQKSKFSLLIKTQKNLEKEKEDLLKQV